MQAVPSSLYFIGNVGIWRSSNVRHLEQESSIALPSTDTLQAILFWQIIECAAKPCKLWFLGQKKLVFVKKWAKIFV